MARGLRLGLPLGCEDREIGAPLDPTLRVPGALPVPDQHDPLRGFDRREGVGTPRLRLHSHTALHRRDLLDHVALQARGSGQVADGAAMPEERGEGREWAGRDEEGSHGWNGLARQSPVFLAGG